MMLEEWDALQLFTFLFERRQVVSIDERMFLWGIWAQKPFMKEN